MGKATGVGSIVFGIILVFLGIGANFSGEASSQTDTGRIVVGFAIILGLLAILGGVTARQNEAKKTGQSPPIAQTTITATTTSMEHPPPPDAGQSAFRPYCGRGIQADFVVCPFCGKSVKKNCPKCGHEVQEDYMACHYCGTSLKSP